MDESLLKRIINHELLHSSFNPNLGVCSGRMGAVIYFFHYARHTGNALFEEFAGELLDDICENVQVYASWTFGKGLCGIAWGIEYLVYQGFVEGNTDEILCEIDQKIMEQNLRRMSDNSFQSGLEGMIWYALARLLSPRSGDIPFDSIYMSDLECVCHRPFLKETCVGASLFLDLQKGKKVSYPYSEILQRIVAKSDGGQETLSWKNGLNLLLQ